MPNKNPLKLFTLSVFLLTCLISFTNSKPGNNQYLSYQVDLKSQELKLYWKDDSSRPLKSLKNLKTLVESKGDRLLFAMNGGMYKEDNSPLGLFIQDYKTLNKLNKGSGYGNFYLKPNGVFYTTRENKAFICKTESFSGNENIKYATQSGPMLLFNGSINAAFNETSTNLNIRNGVGILPNQKIVFAMSKNEVNFYEFATYFKKLGCKEALYLDGFVSRTYLPDSNWTQIDGDFGVIIGVIKKKPLEL